MNGGDPGLRSLLSWPDLAEKGRRHTNECQLSGILMRAGQGEPSPDPLPDHPASTIAAKESALSEAPPTSTPFTSGDAISSPAFPGFTDPP